MVSHYGSENDPDHRDRVDLNDCRAGIVIVFDGLHGMKLRMLESTFDELCRALLVPMMAFAIVVLRGWYNGKKRWPARLIEGAIFGMVATWLHPVARYVFESRFGFPVDIANNAAISFVCALGYIGADTLSDAAKNYFGGRR